jgi:hypothetical protein
MGLLCFSDFSLKMNLGSSALVLNIDAEREFPFL